MTKDEALEKKAENARELGLDYEPVAWMSVCDVGFKRSEFGDTPTVPLYTTPLQRTWVGLTDEIPKGVLLAISNAGLTLLKTQHGYELRKLGPAVAHGIKE